MTQHSPETDGEKESSEDSSRLKKSSKKRKFSPILSESSEDESEEHTHKKLRHSPEKNIRTATTEESSTPSAVPFINISTQIAQKALITQPTALQSLKDLIAQELATLPPPSITAAAMPITTIPYGQPIDPKALLGILPRREVAPPSVTFISQFRGYAHPPAYSLHGGLQKYPIKYYNSIPAPSPFVPSSSSSITTTASHQSHADRMHVNDDASSKSVRENSQEDEEFTFTKQIPQKMLEWKAPENMSILFSKVHALEHPMEIIQYGHSFFSAFSSNRIIQQQKRICVFLAGLGSFEERQQAIEKEKTLLRGKFSHINTADDALFLNSLSTLNKTYTNANPFGRLFESLKPLSIPGYQTGQWAKKTQEAIDAILKKYPATDNQ
ncbi:MAG: hypothetical protein K2X98_02680 [Alphaproteobacteria bacterium]|nr:hypothetical protein [Alphaproteobacteria bacterium]